MLFIFDMGGVVTNTFLMAPLFKKLNITKEDFDNICSIEAENIWKKLETGKINSEQFWTEFNRRIGLLQRALLDGFIKIGDKIINSTDEKLQYIDKVQQTQTDLFRLYFHPVENKQTIKLIDLLKKKHRVVCGTNTIQSHWENHLERGDYAHFHQTYASNKIGLAKPDPEFFRVIMEAEGFTPDQVYFTDDRKINCDAAASLGINAELFTSADSLWQKWSALA